MHDDTNETRLQPEPERSESLVMLMLLHVGRPWPWSMNEIGRELGNELLAADAVAGCTPPGS